MKFRLNLNQRLQKVRSLMMFDFFFYIYDFGIVYVGCNMYGHFPFNIEMFIIIFIILTVIDIFSDVLFYVLAKKNKDGDNHE